MNNGPSKGTSAIALASLHATPTLQAIYQIHENIRPDETQNNTPDKTRIANHGDLKDACAAHPIHCQVTADGSSFTVSVPSQSHQQTFTTKAK
jgi:hypothetical protein